MLISLTPLGLLAAGTAFGEWGPQELKNRLGFVPPGLEKLSGFWHTPIGGHSVPGLDLTIGYVIAAVLGIAIFSGILYSAEKRYITDWRHFYFHWSKI